MDWSDSHHDFRFHFTVLRYRRRITTRTRWVLWPVYGWQVYAPLPAPSSLNLFQRAVLRLAQARIVEVSSVAEQLMFSTDLAARVVLELQQSLLLDARGEITDKGRKELLDDAEEAEQVTTAHVFSDAITGKVWPYVFTGELPTADVEQDERGHIKLLSGSEGDPRKDPSFAVIPSGGGICAKPTASDVLEAVRRHRRRARHDVDAIAPPQERLAKVTVLDQPKPYLVALAVSRPDGEDWVVTEPFGTHESYYLRAAVETELGENEKLRIWLSDLFSKEAASEDAKKLQSSAKWKVESELTIGIHAHALLSERLIAMQRAKLEAEQPGAPADKWDDVLVKAQKVLERLMTDLLCDWPPPPGGDAARLTRNDPDYKQELLNTIARESGFKTPLPPRLTNVSTGKISHAEREGGGTLRPLIILCLLATDRDPRHPLRRLAAQDADLLHHMDSLAAARDAAAHDAKNSRASEIQQHVTTVFVVVRTILDLAQGKEHHVEEE